MADRLYLNYWLRGFTQHNMLARFETMLRCFPVSRLLPQGVLRVYALELAEPPLLEREFSGEFQLDEVISAAQEFTHADCCYQFETAWDIWQRAEGYRLLPSGVLLACYAPLFPSEQGEQLRIDFGPEALYMPDADDPASLTTAKHNLRSLLHLAKDLDKALPVEKRRLWSEGGNFLERMTALLDGGQA